ncbi:otogelin [Amia ocellicauda]|uniref:otogelin n=1 Tax=Amia ocellicauda TaxID=2972642 RepID=UPI003464D0CB
MVQEECNNCTCMGGTWNCTDYSCPGECSVTGDIYFQTFDGRVFTFQATCQYVLVKSRTSGKFTVTIQNTPCGANLDGACIQSVHLVVDEDPRKEITMTHSGEVFVSNQYRITLPYSDDIFQIQELSSLFLQVKTADGLRVQYNWREFRLYVQLDEVWKEDTIGLCGTFNGNIQDDFLSPSGMIESTPQLFGNSWKLSSACVSAHSIPQLDPCDTHQQAASYAMEMCEILNQELFSPCHEYLSPAPFHQHCKADTCKCGKMCLCAALAHYARQCRKYGVILDFRARVSECAVQCPPTLEYGPCVSSCTHRCPSLATTQHCGQECEEGCACPPGTYYSTRTLQCVRKNECPCTFLGAEYAPGDIIVTSSGIQVCKDGRMSPQSPSIEMTCPPDQLYMKCSDSPDSTAWRNGAACEQTCESHLLNLTCSGHEPCVSGCVCPPGLLKHGEECFEPAACPCLWKGKEYYPGDRVTSPCHSCVCQHGSFQCVFHPCPSMCTAYGDRHYRTFDGLLFDYVGACKVYLVKSSKDLTMSVTAENVDCYDNGVICRKSLLLNIGKSFIVFDNDSGKPNPSSLIDKKQNIFIWQAGYYTILHIPDEDITVLWDKKTTIHIQAGPRWQGKLTGLCGNFDMKTVNEMRTPENIESATPQEFGNSWTASECVNSPDVRNPCSLNPLREPFAKRECGILLSEVFQVCHPVVDVTWFYMNCLVDTCGCSRGGDCECFCTSVSAYAHRCCQQGISVDWRSPSVCPYDCEFYNKVLGKGPFKLVTYKESDTVLAANLSGSVVFPVKGGPIAPGVTTLFMMTPGLSRTRSHDTSLVSFEAAERPNYFLHLDPSGRLQLTKWVESERFQDEATFIIHRDTWISGYDSLESYTKTGLFVHFMLSWVHLMKYNHTEGFREATLFKIAESDPEASVRPVCQWRYEVCASACFKTCTDPTGHICTTIPKVEGCLPQCPHLMVLDEVTQRCVHLEDCIKPTVAVEPITPHSTVSTPAAVTSQAINATASSTAHSVTPADTVRPLSISETKSTASTTISSTVTASPKTLHTPVQTPGATDIVFLRNVTTLSTSVTKPKAGLTPSPEMPTNTTTGAEPLVTTAGPAVLESRTTEKISEPSATSLASPSSLYTPTQSTASSSTISTIAPFWMITTPKVPATSQKTTSSFPAHTDSKQPTTLDWSSDAIAISTKTTTTLAVITTSLASKETEITSATSKIKVTPMYTTAGSKPAKQTETSRVTETSTVTAATTTGYKETSTRVMEGTTSTLTTKPMTSESTLYASPADTIKTTEPSTPDTHSPLISTTQTTSESTTYTTTLDKITDTTMEISPTLSTQSTTSLSTAHSSPLKTEPQLTSKTTPGSTEYTTPTELKTSTKPATPYTPSTAPVSAVLLGTTSTEAASPRSVSPPSTETEKTTSVFLTELATFTKTTIPTLTRLTTSLATSKIPTTGATSSTPPEEKYKTTASTERISWSPGIQSTESTTSMPTEESIRISIGTTSAELKTTSMVYPADTISANATTSQTTTSPPLSMEVSRMTLKPTEIASTIAVSPHRTTPTSTPGLDTTSTTPSYSSSTEYSSEMTTTTGYKPTSLAISHPSTTPTTKVQVSTLATESLSQPTTLKTTPTDQTTSVVAKIATTPHFQVDKLTTTGYLVKPVTLYPSTAATIGSTLRGTPSLTSVKPSVSPAATGTTSQTVSQTTTATLESPSTTKSTIQTTPVPESKPISFSSATTKIGLPVVSSTATGKMSAITSVSYRTTVLGNSTTQPLITSMLTKITSTVMVSEKPEVSTATTVMSTLSLSTSSEAESSGTTASTTVTSEKIPTTILAVTPTLPTSRSTLESAGPETTQSTTLSKPSWETSKETSTVKLTTEKVTGSLPTSPSWTSTTSLHYPSSPPITLPSTVSTTIKTTERLMPPAATTAKNITAATSTEPIHTASLSTEATISTITAAPSSTTIPPERTEKTLVPDSSTTPTAPQPSTSESKAETMADSTIKTSMTQNATAAPDSLKTTASRVSWLTSSKQSVTAPPSSVFSSAKSTASTSTQTSQLSLSTVAQYTNRTEHWPAQSSEAALLTEHTRTPAVLLYTTDHSTTVAASTKMCTPPYSEIIDECTKYVCMNGQLMLFNKSQNCPYNATPPNCGLLGFAILVNGDKCCPQWDCPCRCSVFPDLNVITFDGNSVAIYKAASYIVTQLPNETVSIQVQECQSSDMLLWNFTNLCLVGLNITHKSHQVLINRLQRRLYINSRYARPRFKKHGFEVLDTGNMYLIRTPAGLKIQWFHSTGMMVIETENYSNRLTTMGLCGCCDGDPTNDLTMSNGTTMSESEDPTLFIDSWQIPNTTSFMGQNRRREVNCSTSDCSDCLGMLSNHTFSSCHSFVPPSIFCEVWVRDAEYVKNPCIALAAYVAACHKFNICIEWRSPDYCSFTCPPELRYQACLPACNAQTCPNHEFDSDPEECSGLTEGCVCPEGTLLHRPYSALCIPTEKCACTDSFGTPHAAGEVWKASKDGCCMYKCDNDSIVPVAYNCTHVPEPVCTRTGEIAVSLADDKSCCPQKACVCNQTLCNHFALECKYGEKLVSYYKDDSCCPEAKCECDPDHCESDIPTCREDQTLIATRADGSCCMAYICMCGACSDIIPVCQEGEVLTVDANSTDRCCPAYHCVCELYRCSEFRCPLGMSVVTAWSPEKCCPLNTCECACDLIPKPKCTLGETLQIDSQFLADPENQCGCTKYKCDRELVCVDGERGVMRPGQTLVEHTVEGICYTTQCTNSLDPLTLYYKIRVSSTNCSSHCQPNQVYIPPKDLTTCCGVCKNISCVYHMDNGSIALYKPGKTWISNCMTYDCTDTLSGPTLISYSVSCPPFNETECMKIGGTVVSYMDGCCKTCKEDGKSCQKVTVRMTIRKNDCRSNRPVNIVSCDGKCPSASIYNYNINTYARFCKCCREIGLQRRSVQLYCSGNSTWVYYSIQEPTDCSCQWS